MSPDFNHEVEMMTEFAYDESDGDLRILFKHDYYSSDNSLGTKLLDSFLDNLILEADRICLLIVVDSAVKLLDNNPKFSRLVELSPSTLICNDSLAFYGIDYEASKPSVTKLVSEDIIDTILNSDPNVIIE